MLGVAFHTFKQHKNYFIRMFIKKPWFLTTTAAQKLIFNFHKRQMQVTEVKVNAAQEI